MIEWIGHLTKDEDDDFIPADTTVITDSDSSESSTPEVLSRVLPRRWSSEENHLFLKKFRKYLKEKRMPNSAELGIGCKRLVNRTRAQIRTKVHNIIKQKQAVPKA